jgi:hypothetical protein
LDSAIIPGRSVEANRPDIVVFYKKEKSPIIVDISIPLDDNLKTTIDLKKTKVSATCSRAERYLQT